MPEDKRLERQQSYHQFHLGVYISLASAVIGASVFLESGQLKDAGGRALLLTILAFLALSGACGGVVAAKIPEAETYASFLTTKIGFRPPLLGREIWTMPPKDWETWEHFFFWVAVLIYPAFIGWTAIFSNACARA